MAKKKKVATAPPPDAALPGEAWEQQSDESLPAFAAFVAYRDLGDDRSLRRVGQALGKSGSLVSDWSARYQWVKRVAAWQRHCDRQRQAAMKMEIEDLARKNVQLAMAAHSHVAAMLERVMDLFTAAAAEEDGAGVALNAVPKFMAVLSTIEKNARAQSAYTLELTGKDGGPVQVTDAKQFLASVLGADVEP